MNDLSQPVAPAIGSLWQDFDGSPWPARFPPVRVTDVRDGWVRFATTTLPDSDYRLSLNAFLRAYRCVEVPRGAARMSAAHTPGPWAVTRRGDAISAGNMVGGMVVVCTGIKDSANAALLAAAPDMHETLRAAIEEMDAWMLERTPTADDIDEMRSEFRAVLAKVEGKS